MRPGTVQNFGYLIDCQQVEVAEPCHDAPPLRSSTAHSPSALTRNQNGAFINMAKERTQYRPIANKDKKLMEQLLKDDIERNRWMLPKDV
jgi:hypothetical protein